MRERTSFLHRRAEQAGVVGAMIRGEASRGEYAVFLRNLLPAYRALETALAMRSHSDDLRALLRTEVVRAPSIERDLIQLAGADWEGALPLLPEARAYANRIAHVAEGTGARLVAHAYTRYLGDLGGGQILKRRLGTTLDLDATALSFYEFPLIGDVRAFAADYRTALDAASGAADRDPIIEEAIVAFQLNIRLSEAIRP